jgi:hypothetical protein
MVAGGLLNRAAGASSFAAGQYAHAQNRGCFVWADASSEDAFVCAGDNAFIARAAGGFYLRTNAAATTGVSLTGGSGHGHLRATAEHIVPVDPKKVLERLAHVPIATWNYKAQDAKIRHMGPMAQDLHAAFGLGESERYISTVDADGSAFAAIQGLNDKLEARIAEQAQEIAELRRAVEVLMARTATTSEVVLAK